MDNGLDTRPFSGPPNTISIQIRSRRSSEFYHTLQSLSLSFSYEQATTPTTRPMAPLDQ